MSKISQYPFFLFVHLSAIYDNQPPDDFYALYQKRYRQYLDFREINEKNQSMYENIEEYLEELYHPKETIKRAKEIKEIQNL